MVHPWPTRQCSGRWIEVRSRPLSTIDRKACLDGSASETYILREKPVSLGRTWRSIWSPPTCAPSSRRR